MSLAWQESRGCALLVNTETSQIVGKVSWDDSRQIHQGEYTGPIAGNRGFPKEPEGLGIYTTVNAAKKAVEDRCAQLEGGKRVMSAGAGKELVP